MLYSPNIPDTWKNLERFAEKGLGTLILCQKEISQLDYEKWAKRYQVYNLQNQNLFNYLLKIRKHVHQ